MRAAERYVLCTCRVVADGKPTRYKRRIKANSPFANTIVVEIANGYHGYISPDLIQRAGNYEGIYSMVAYTGLGSADTLIHGATDMLYALYYSDNQASFGGLRPKPLQ